MANTNLGELVFSTELESGSFNGGNELAFLVPGQLYIVDVDGILYESECIEVKANFSVKYLGDPSQIGVGDPTGEPFAAWCIENGALSAIKTEPEASHITIYLKAEGGETEPSEGMSIGKKYMLHQMFHPVIARALCGGE